MGYDHEFIGVFLKWGYPNSWMVKLENPNIKWMMAGGTPISGNLHIDYDLSGRCTLDTWDMKKDDFRGYHHGL